MHFPIGIQSIQLPKLQLQPHLGLSLAFLFNYPSANQPNHPPTYPCKNRENRRIIKGIRRITNEDQDIPKSKFTPKVTSTPKKSPKLDPYISNSERSPVRKKRRVKFTVVDALTKNPG